MKKGRLGQSEKYIIQGMVSDGKPVGEIAVVVKRSETCVQNYIDNELDQVIDHVVQGKVDSHNIQEQEKVEPGSFQKSMIKKTADKEIEGISIMTQTASEIVEKHSTKEKNHRSRIKDSIFNIKENRMENEK